MATVNRFSKPTQLAKFDPSGIENILKMPVALQAQEDAALAESREWLKDMYNTTSTDADAQGVRDARQGLEAELESISEDIRTKGINRAQTNRLLDLKGKYDRAISTSGSIGGPNQYAKQRDAEKAIFYKAGIENEKWSKDDLDKMWKDRTAGRTAFNEDGSIRSEFEGVGLPKNLDPNKEFREMKLGLTSIAVDPITGAPSAEGRTQMKDNATQIKGAITGIYKKYITPGTDQYASAQAHGWSDEYIWSQLQQEGIARLTMDQNNDEYVRSLENKLQLDWQAEQTRIKHENALEIAAMKKKKGEELTAKEKADLLLAQEERFKTVPGAVYEVAPGEFDKDPVGMPTSSADREEKLTELREGVKTGLYTPEQVRKWNQDVNKVADIHYKNSDPQGAANFVTKYSGDNEVGRAVDIYDKHFGDEDFVAEASFDMKDAFEFAARWAGTSFTSPLSQLTSNELENIGYKVEYGEKVKAFAEDMKAAGFDNDMENEVENYITEKKRMRDVAFESLSAEKQTIQAENYFAYNPLKTVSGAERTKASKYKEDMNQVFDDFSAYDIVYATVSDPDGRDMKGVEFSNDEDEGAAKRIFLANKDKAEFLGISGTADTAPHAKYQIRTTDGVYQIEMVLKQPMRQEGTLTTVGALMAPLQDLGNTGPAIYNNAVDYEKFSSYTPVVGNNVDWRQSSQLKDRFVNNQLLSGKDGTFDKSAYDMEVFSDTSDKLYRVRIHKKSDVVGKESNLTYKDALQSKAPGSFDTDEAVNEFAVAQAPLYLLMTNQIMQSYAYEAQNNPALKDRQSLAYSNWFKEKMNELIQSEAAIIGRTKGETMNFLNNR